MNYTNLTWEELLKKANNWFDLPRVVKEGFTRLKALIAQNTGIPTLQQVTEAGNEIVSDDELFKIVINRNSGRIEVYERADVVDAFVLKTTYGDNINVKSTNFKIGDLDGDNYGTVIYIDNDEGSIHFQRNLVNHTTFSKGSIGGVNLSDVAWGFSMQDVSENVTLNFPNLPNGIYDIQVVPIPQTTNFTAINNQKYTANGTLTVTDPTSVTNKGYVVHVIGGTATIGGVGYTAGALVYRYYDGSVWVSKDYGLSTASDFLNDAAASVGGIPVGDLYHTSGVVKIRIT